MYIYTYSQFLTNLSFSSFMHPDFHAEMPQILQDNESKTCLISMNLLVLKNKICERLKFKEETE